MSTGNARTSNSCIESYNNPPQSHTPRERVPDGQLTPLIRRHTTADPPPENGGRVRHRRVCELDGREVRPEETARGWEAPDGRTVVIQDADLEALPLPTKRVIDVLGFVDEAQDDPLLYARPYCMGAHGPGAQRPYALLVEALARSGRLAVCKVALRSRERPSVKATSSTSPAAWSTSTARVTAASSALS
ncbi:Ku protein [Streptomyces sp. MS1.AVA.3]|uniref:Ku protein n=1 Tax=Streptomyces decoyicus TaxID=249567 RepID=UPI0030BB783D